jgi:hypothetical protein
VIFLAEAATLSPLLSKASAHNYPNPLEAPVIKTILLIVILFVYPKLPLLVRGD